ncbi:MAG: hypothetical protein HUU57_05940 [Bdellovibrio sp.]|nr:hypothetical protein [Bdellovibrio sp.]
MKTKINWIPLNSYRIKVQASLSKNMAQSENLGYNTDMKHTGIFSFILVLSLPVAAQLGAKQRVDLDDVQIKGEAQNRGMSVLSRTKNSLDGRITIRTNFKNEIIDEIPEYFSTKKKSTN